MRTYTQTCDITGQVVMKRFLTRAIDAAATVLI